MKKQIRILGIDDAAFDKFNDKKVIVIGTVFRGGDFMDGVMTCKVDVDGSDATSKIMSMINKSKFKIQFKAILLDGIAVAGFNVIDIPLLYEKTKVPVMVIMRDYPDLKKIKDTLKKIDMADKIKLIESAGPIHPYKKIHYQCHGMEKEVAESILKITCTHSFIPEPIRIAHLIGSGLTFGESKGRA
jgi:hypothetical protein